MPQAASAYADTRNMYAIHMLFRREFGLLPPPRATDVVFGTPSVSAAAH